MAEEKYQCPSCASENVTWRSEIDKFPYGVETQVELEAVVLVGKCGNCGFEYTDYRSDNSRAVAVERYLREATPDESQ